MSNPSIDWMGKITDVAWNKKLTRLSCPVVSYIWLLDQSPSKNYFLDKMSLRKIYLGQGQSVKYFVNGIVLQQE